MAQALIGITGGPRRGMPPGGRLVAVREQYVRAILAAGGLPVAIPPAAPAVLRAIFARLDGLLLPGGGDIDPGRYGDAPHPRLGKLEPERDEAELALARWALDEGKPVLGICRGQQVLNVAAGGDLYQDMPSQCPGSVIHQPSRRLPRGYLAHHIVLERASRLAAIVGDDDLPVNSWHHQAVRRVAGGLVVSARAADGAIEGLEAPGHRFALSLQCHPEDLYEADERLHRLFRAFVAACEKQ